VRFTLVLAGAAVAEIGFVVCAPAVVGAVGRVARRLPLTVRLAVRDASRHRGRTGPAVAAVLAAVAGSIAMSAWISSTVAMQRQQYQPQLRVGQSGVQVLPGATGSKAVDVAALTAAIGHDLPGAGLMPLSTTSCMLVERPCTGVFLQPRSSCLQSGAACAVNLGTGGLAVGGADVLDELLGRHDAKAAAALARGDVVVFSPLVAEGSRTTLTFERFNTQNGATHDRVVSSYVADVGRQGAAAAGIMTPTTAQRLHAPAYPSGYLLSTQTQPTQGQEDALQADLQRFDANVIVERGFHPQRWNYGLIALAGAAALVTLGATAVATALSAADSRPDLVTLAAVGAAPRLRRRFAASQAATVAVLGTLLGTVAGVIPAWTVIGAHGHMPFAMPWPTVGVVVVGVPLLAAFVTALLTRSALPSERRLA
jgi:putative ABC transport system permease protein